MATSLSLPHKPGAVPRRLLSPLPAAALCQATLPPLLRDSVLMLQTRKFESQALCIPYILPESRLLEAFLLIQGVSVEQPSRGLAILVK